MRLILWENVPRDWLEDFGLKSWNNYGIDVFTATCNSVFKLNGMIAQWRLMQAACLAALSSLGGCIGSAAYALEAFGSSALLEEDAKKAPIVRALELLEGIPSKKEATSRH